MAQREAALAALLPLVASATVPIPAIVVPTSDPRLFPTEEMLEKDRMEAKEKQLPPMRPVLYTTVVEDPPPAVGCKGKCDFKGCECLYFAQPKPRPPESVDSISSHVSSGPPPPEPNPGECLKCGHANLYHRVKIRRVDLEAKAAADALKKMKHRRHIPTLKEIEEQKEQEVNKPPEPVNTYPCDVPDCECKKMQQPPGWDPATLVPKLCRNCRHAEMYHIKRKKEDKNKRRGGSSGTKGGKGSASGSKASSAASTQRGTARGKDAKKGSGKKK